MKKECSEDLQQTVLRLQREYLERLPRSLELARDRVNALRQGAANENTLADLYRCFHNIKGTASTLGLRAISEGSSEASELVAQLRRLDCRTHRQAIAGLNARLSELETLAGEAVYPDPVATEADAALMSHVKAGSRTGSQRGCIFLFDTAPDAISLANQLACFGYQISYFSTSDELRAAMHERQPDAVVMTVSAIDELADLRDQHPLPFLYLSESNGFAARLKVVKAGGKAFFLKPIAAHEIVNTLDELTIEREPDPFRILIVDDEPEMADYLSLILDATGMLSRRLNEPTRILEVLTEFQPDLVLMDIYMPGCSGREISSLIRQDPRFVSIPIIFLSSETDKTVQLRAMRVGADGFLTKPILPEDLISAVVVRAERTRILRSLMMRDGLTGLLNHTTLTQFLETSVAGARRHQTRLCFAMLDLDFFKAVNDRYGHPVGDQVLVALARMLKQRLRSSDLVGRYGGEEFAVIFMETSEETAAQTLQKILNDFSTLSFKAGANYFSCSFSAGVSGFPSFKSAEQLVLAADQALYRAKNNGRNQIVPAKQTAD
ncbi:MAG: putative Response regulator PleD Diguanylate [Proteobacteria bacterium]|nr:putative Response regulator PleD Diguanylate [Pseudomonadota bacterium]